MKKTWITFLILIISIFICISLGSVAIPLDVTAHILFKGQPLAENQRHYVNIIQSVRLPRVLATMLVGMALSLSGAIMQGLLQNPLADGSTLGVSSGASLGAVLSIIFSQWLPQIGLESTFVGASLGALLGFIIILYIARMVNPNYSSLTIILVGIIFSMFTSSIISFLITFAGDKLRTIVFWSLGSLAGARYQDVIILALVVLITSLIVIFKAVDLNALSLGEDHAHNIGLNVKKSRFIFLLAASLLIGTSVAVAGSIAFVGLIIPHISRMIAGSNHRNLLVSSLLNGGVFLLWTDLLARTIMPPRELPIGVISSFIGSIVFIFILLRQRRSSL